MWEEPGQIFCKNPPEDYAGVQSELSHRPFLQQLGCLKQQFVFISCIL